MKKIILVLTLLPSLFFGQCTSITEIDLIGVSINFNEKKLTLQSNNQIIENGIKKGKWSIDKNILKVISSWSWTYFYDLSSGLNKFNEIEKTWAEDNQGKSVVSKMAGWKDFDKNYYYLLDRKYSVCIENFINKKIKIWEKKGEFEKTIDFQKRVNNN